jgi:hypothetical protein
MAGGSTLEMAAADLRRGLGVSPEDLAIAAMVMLPFAATAGIFVNVVTGWPSAVTLVLTAALQVLATLWNAGWRARTAGE